MEQLINPPEIAIPIAYFITFTCYGTWLHGEKLTSVDKNHNIPQTPFVPFNSPRMTSAKKRMIESPYLLDEKRRSIVLQAIKEVCEYQAWVLFAAHIRTNHVHMVIYSDTPPEIILNTIKAYSSRHLNRAEVDKSRKSRWTRHGSTRYLWKEEELEATIQYVIYEQGEPMAQFVNKNHVQPSRDRQGALHDANDFMKNL